MRHAKWARCGAAFLAVLFLSAGCGGDGGNEQGTRSARPVAAAGCYARHRLGIDPPPVERALFVLIDQTTGLDDRLRETVTANVRRLLVPGTSYAISTFSAFSRGNYVTIAAEGRLDAPVPESGRSNLPVRRLERVDRCLAEQATQQAQRASAEIARATSAAASSFANSEIMASLAQLSEAVRASPAREKLVLVVSDLLEHSTATSFYRARQLRQIDPAAELRRAAENRLLGDFGNARVAVVGAGLLSPESGADSVRQIEAMNALSAFWSAWFAESQAELAQYGRPDLVTPLAWGGRSAP